MHRYRSLLVIRPRTLSPDKAKDLLDAGVRQQLAHLDSLRVRFQIIRNARIDNVGESQTCMVSKLRIIWKQTVGSRALLRTASSAVGTAAGRARLAFTESTERALRVRLQLIGHARNNI